MSEIMRSLEIYVDCPKTGDKQSIGFCKTNCQFYLGEVTQTLFEKRNKLLCRYRLGYNGSTTND